MIRGLLEAGAIGLVTTHDLALAQLAGALAPRAANVHFEDHLENGRMTFDYRVRDGVVRKSNALALMRSVGLRVEGRSPGRRSGQGPRGAAGVPRGESGAGGSGPEGGLGTAVRIPLTLRPRCDTSPSRLPPPCRNAHR